MWNCRRMERISQPEIKGNEVVLNMVNEERKLTEEDKEKLSVAYRATWRITEADNRRIVSGKKTSMGSMDILKEGQHYNEMKRKQNIGHSGETLMQTMAYFIKEHSEEDIKSSNTQSYVTYSNAGVKVQECNVYVGCTLKTRFINCSRSFYVKRILIGCCWNKWNHHVLGLRCRLSRWLSLPNVGRRAQWFLLQWFM